MGSEGVMGAEEDKGAAKYLMFDGQDTTGIGHNALWSFGAKCLSGVEWMGDTPQTVMTTRAPAVLKRCCRPFLMFIYGKQCHFTKKSKETLEKNKIADFSLVKSAPELRNDQKQRFAQFFFGIVYLIWYLVNPHVQMVQIMYDKGGQGHMGLKHASREKKLSMVNFLIFVHKNVYRIRFQKI